MTDIWDAKIYRQFLDLRRGAIKVVRNIGQDLMQNWAAQQCARAGEHVTKRMSHASKNTKKSLLAHDLRTS
jgi:hypothetical protein